MSMLLRAISPPSAEDRALSPAQDEAVEPSHRELQGELLRLSPGCGDAPAGEYEETLIVDTRADLSPAQMVEQKLLILLRDKALPVSHMHVANMLRTRS